MRPLVNKLNNLLLIKPNQIFLILLPFLILYIILIITGMHEDLRKDEWRYLYYAKNLLNGIYSPPDTVFLWNGPGYPIAIAPFVAMKLPFGFIRLLNGLFYYLSLIFIFKSFTFYFSPSKSMLAAVIMGIYLPAFEMLKYMMSEPIVIFLFSLLIYSIIKIYHESKIKWFSFLLPAFVLAFLILVKVIFAYALIAMIFISAIGWLFLKGNIFKTSLGICVLTLILCLPYLIYTYNLSGKIFYWSNAGGMQLYWMSTPYPEEYGDWINFINSISRDEEIRKQFTERHGEFIKEVYHYEPLFSGVNLDTLVYISDLNQDLEFKKKAIENIKEYPLKYLKNWVFNISRMLFDTPYSFQKPNTKFLRYIPYHIPAIVLCIVVLLRVTIGSIRLPIPVIWIGIFTLIYLGGSSLVSAYPRQFYIIFPAIMLISWFGFKDFNGDENQKSGR